MNDLNNKKTIGKILLYAIVGISCFAFWLMVFSFVIGDFNVFSWESVDRFFMVFWWIGSIILSAVTIEVR